MTDTTPSEYEPETAAKGPQIGDVLPVTSVTYTGVMPRFGPIPTMQLRIAVYVNLPSEPERLQQAWVGSDGTVEWRDVPREIVE